MTVLLTRRATLQAALETTYNTPASIDNTDGILVSAPSYTVTPNVLERDYTRPDISQVPFIIGRKLAKMEFETELRGNGIENAGTAASAPVLVRLFQACGFELIANPGPTCLGPYSLQTQPTAVVFVCTSEAPSNGVLTGTGEPSNGDNVTIGGKTYTFATTLSGSTPGQVLIGGSLANALINLGDAINLGTGAGTTYDAGTLANPQVYCSATTGTTLTVTALQAGTGGNLIASAYTSTVLSWGHGTLQNGTNAGTNTDVYAYFIKVTLGGVSGTAQVTVTSDLDSGVSGSPITITSGTPFNIGSYGLQVSMTWTGSLVIGQYWNLTLLPAGLLLKPISDNFQSVTLVMNKDGVQHSMPGSIGTFEITAEAGNYARVKWTFTGSYVEPFDAALPNPNYETTLPSQVQLARLLVGTFAAIVSKFTYNQGNDIQPRLDVSASDGYLGVRLVSRKPEGGIDPEADLVSNYDFWGRMSAAQCMSYQMRVGTTVGNAVWLFGTNVQYSGLTYQDRSGISTYQAGLRFARQIGDDELFILFA